MAVGDQAFFEDLILNYQLPSGWFDTTGPVINGVASAIANSAAFNFEQIAYASLQKRIATATDVFVDICANDYLGQGNFVRNSGESDTSYSARIRAEVIRARSTRQAVIEALEALTGNTPTVFEPNRIEDTGSIGNPANFALNVAGRLGSYALPFQFFIDIKRPLPQGDPFLTGISSYGGIGAGFALGYPSTSGITDAEIYQCIANTIPAGVTAWTNIYS